MAVFILLHLVALHDSSGWIFYFYLILLGILHRYLNKYFTFYYQLRYLIIIVLFITLLIIFILAGPACMAQLSTIVTKIIFFKNRQIGVNLFSQLYYVKSYLFIYNIKPLLSDRQYSSYTRSPAENKSTSCQESRIQPSLNNFYEWFCGLADAESSFYIKVKPKSVEFEFKIALHKDDLPVLLFIKEKLGIGKIDTSLNMASFRVGKLNELIFLLEIFEKFPLNSTKYLNYLDFKKGIKLYIKSKSSSTIEIIYNLKSRMNTKRTDFTLPESHQLRITPYWVLGFTEGEGCFSVKKVHPFSLTFSLTQKNNTTLMKALQEFFHNLGVTHNWRNKESAVSVSVDNRIGNKGDITNIYITRVNYITDVLIPFFDSLSWHSKKEQDYKDWKTVLELKKLGLHWLEEGVRVINLILSQINLNRLSTNPARLSPIQLDKLRRDIDKLLSGPSNLEIKADGRIFIKSLNKYYTGSGNIKVNLIGKNGLLNHSFDSISECAKFLGFSAGTVTNRLRDNKPVKVGSKELFVYKGIHNGVIISKRNEIQLGPKFLHNKSKSYHLRSSRQTSNDFIGCPWSKHRLPVIIISLRQTINIIFAKPKNNLMCPFFLFAIPKFSAVFYRLLSLVLVAVNYKTLPYDYQVKKPCRQLIKKSSFKLNQVYEQDLKILTTIAILQQMSHSTSLVVWGQSTWLLFGCNYSSAPSTVGRSVEKFKLNPWWVTGFIDGEGCFNVSITENKKLNQGWEVQHRFIIGLHIKDKSILQEIYKYLRVGKIYKHGSEAIQWQVKSRKELKVILDHFDKYPLITNKQADYNAWKLAYFIIKNKEHLTNEGLHRIVAIRASMNLGLSDVLKKAFPDVVPVTRSIVLDQKIQDPNWLAGFTGGEGCFSINILKDRTKHGEAVHLDFRLTQHERDKILMKSFIKYLNCGTVNKNRDVCVFRVTKFDDIINKIIPFFKKHPIYGVKALDFADWCQVAYMIQDKKHLTPEGLEKIKQIKAGMNRGRKWNTLERIFAKTCFQGS